eukprot:10327526-Alexandrium_andersonii.AAC.1
MVFAPSREQAIEALSLREEALTEVLSALGNPATMIYFQPAALFPAEPSFWLLMGDGLGEEAPMADIIGRLRAVEGSLD